MSPQHQELRPCGECSMCCKLLRIDKCADGGELDFPFNKPGGVMCKHFAPGKGCTLYGTERFPSVCKSFLCLWKVEKACVPAEYRPDKLHVIFRSSEEIPEFPGHPIAHVEVNPNRKPDARFLEWVEDRLA